MKKFFTLGILTLLFVLLTGCANYSYEETQIETTVIQCEKGDFHPNSAYQASANMYLAKQDYAKYSMYTSLANATGIYDYNVTVHIDGTNHIIVRSEQYETGDKIVVVKVNTFENSQLVNTQYK